MKSSREKGRLVALGVLVWLVFAVFLLRLAQLQIVGGADYLARQQQGSSKTQVVKAARGEILDRNGSPFAQNEVCYTIVFDRALAPEGSTNETILRLIEILRARSEPWIDTLPLEKTAPYAFTDAEQDVRRIKSKAYLDLNSYATAEETFYWLRERYGLQSYALDDARAIAGVRYEMERKGYSYTVRYTFAEDISLETAVLVRQSGSMLPGVDVVETARRVYVDGGLAPHLVGRVGAIFPDELEEYLSRNKGYTRDDLVGKEGLERAFEDTLRGTDGVRRIDFNASYKVTDVVEERAPVPGNTLVTTIDKRMQGIASQALADQIRRLQQTAAVGKGREANAGAAVAVDIKTGEVLVAVTEPSYDLSTYSADYAENASNPLYPFLNRALSGVYAPGSCFKPTTAVAGLNEGVITPESIVNCERIYTFYPTYQPTCLSFHGNMSVVDALRASCNVFFYDTGRKLGIATLNRYARALGLGSPTGIELSEAIGTQSDPDTLNPGDVLQTAIGQLDNGYTPIQLANYTATLARKGVRLKLTLIKSISSYYDRNDTLEVHQPEVAEKLDAPAEVFDTVHRGMIAATHDPRGTAYTYLGDYPLTVASKTGTPETQEFPNSTFICFAPAEDPQIAIAVVIEKGWHGYTGAPVARAILDAYFFPDGVGEGAPDTALGSAPEDGAAVRDGENPVEVASRAESASAR